MDPATIAAAIGGVTELIKLINAARARARTTGEMTEEQDREFDAKLEAAFKADHWKL